MPARQSVQVVRPLNGGQLVTVASPENVEASNYVVKTNWRRLEDREVVREGTVLFRPNVSIAQGTQALVLGATEVNGLWEAVRPNGERAVIAMSATTIYKYDYTTGTWSVIGSGYSTSGRRWQVESMDGYLIFNNTVDLPFSYRVEDATVTPMYEMREMGIAAVGTISVFNGLFLAADLTEIIATELADVLNSEDPYGLVDAADTNRVRYKISWSDYGDPTNWAVLVTGTIETGSKSTVTLEYPVSAFVADVTRVAVIGGGAGGGTLGGDDTYPEGILVTSVTSNVLTLEAPADASLTYPLTVSVTRFADVSTFSGSFSLKDDSSAIIRMKPLNRGLLAVYRETGIFHGRYTGEVEAPFSFSPVYSGRNVPFYPDAVQELEGDRHVYPTQNRFYVYDGAGEPQLMKPLDHSRTAFFAGATAASVFAAHNPLTKEIWFFCSTGVLAYDYTRGTTSWIDEAYSAAAFVRKPDGTASTHPSEFMFLLARAGSVLRYGLTEAGVATYTRLGAAYTATLKGCFNSFGDDNNEKDLIAVTPMLGAESDDVLITMKLYGCDNVAQDPQLLLTYEIDQPTLLNEVGTFYRNIYFQDELIVEVDGEGISVSARQFKVRRINSDGITR